MTPISSLVQGICQATLGDADRVLVKDFSFQASRQNQLVFFFKPEVFLVRAPDQRLALVTAALEVFQKYEIEIRGCAAISGRLLAKSEAMDRHYGFINRVSRRASAELSPDHADEIRQALGAAKDTPILGGHEYLRSHGADAFSLDEMWQQHQSTKIRSGLYVELIDQPTGSIILVNGFHPAQLAHFTDDGRWIVLMLINSDCPWSILRSRMLGDTFPEKAHTGSMRRIFKDEATRFGLGQVDITNNCVHLSAGPFEALYEMRNFFTHELGFEFALKDANLARLMRTRGLDSQIERCLTNPGAEFDNRKENLFDITEGLDSQSSVELFRIAFANPTVSC